MTFTDVTAGRRLTVRSVLIVLAFVLVLAGCGGTTVKTVTTTKSAENAPEQTATGTSPATTPTETTPSVTKAFGDGSHTVGVDVKAGTYRAPDPSVCYWERVSGFGGTLDEIIANDNTSDPAVVTIAPSDKGFTSRGCGDWTAELKQVTTSKTSFGAGTYIVHTDIEPGTYRSTGGANCYWARLSGFGGTLDDIITNDRPPTGPFNVTIAASDKGFSSTDCGTFTRMGAATSGGGNAGAEAPTGGTTAALPNHCSPGLSTTQGVPCALASNMFYEYHRAVQSGKDTTALMVWSPAVKQYRTANCSKGTGVITCQISGTNVPNAQVQITQAALDAYTPQHASDYARTHDLGPNG